MKIKCVEIRGHGLYNLCRAAIERKKEPDVEIFGNKRNKKIKVVNAYPLLSANSNPTWVDYGNKTAIKRLTVFEDAIRMPFSSSANPKGKYYKVGMAHSHIGPKSSDPDHAGTELGKDDLNEIKKRMCNFGMKEWLEIAMLVTFKRYKTLHKVGADGYSYKKRVRFLIKGKAGAEKLGFDIIMGAHFVYFDENEELKHRELPILIPSWNLV